MFKKLQKSVIDKNKLLAINLSKRRVNKTPSKIIFPNRTNLTFANIIVNMGTTPNQRSMDNWNNSYFTTELYNNSFISKSKNNNNQIKNNIQTIKNNSKLLSIIIDGIINLKSNDLLGYSIKLIEFMVYIRDNNIDNNTFIDIKSQTNKDFFIFIYQTYFQTFHKDSIICLLLKNDLQNGMKIFRKIHSIYVFFILSGIIYIYNNLKLENKNFYDFLKQFIKNEKCNDFNCLICSQIEKIEKNILNFNDQNPTVFPQKSSVIKIVGKKATKNNIINNSNINKIKKNKKYNIINNSNDNIIKKNSLNSQSYNKDRSFNKNNKKKKIDNNYYAHITNERNNTKILNIKGCKNNNNDNKKKNIL